MADDVEIGIDGSDAESGVRRILSSLDKVGKASDSLAKKASSDFQKIFDKLKSIGDSSIISKYEKMTGSMERAAAKVQRSHAVMSANIAQSSSKTAASIGHMTSSLAKLEGFKGPSKSGVRNTQDLLSVVGSMKAVNTAGLSSLAGISGFKGPSGSAVKNTQILLQALSGSKLSSTLTRLSVLDNITNFRGPSSRSVDNTQRLLDVISRARFSSGSGLGEAAALLNSIGNAGARLGGTATRAGAASSALTRLGGASRQGATGLGALAQQADRTNQALFHTERFFGTLANVAGLSFVSGEINKMDSASAAIQTVTNSLAATSAEMAFLTKTAQDNGTYLGSLTRGYSSFRTAAAGAGLAIADTQTLFAGVTRASRVYNLSLDDQEGVYRALTQIMGKNSLQQEELRGQLGDRMPVAIQAMARALGVTIPVMNEMTKKGQVSGKVLTDAFSRLGPILSEMTAGGFAASMDTIGAKTSQLKTEAMLLSVAMGEAGLKRAITNVLSDVTSLITEGGALYNMMMGVGQAALFLSQNLGTLMSVGLVALIGKFVLTEKAIASVKVAFGIMTATEAASIPVRLSAAKATQALTAEIASLTLTLKGEEAAQLAAARASALNTISKGALARATNGTAASSFALMTATNATAGSLSTLQGVAGGAAGRVGMVAGSMTLLGRGAALAGGAVRGLLAMIGLTNPITIAIAAFVILIGVLKYFQSETVAARKAQEALKTSQDAASNSALAAAGNVRLSGEAYAQASAEVRAHTDALLRNAAVQTGQSYTAGVQAIEQFGGATLGTRDDINLRSLSPETSGAVRDFRSASTLMEQYRAAQRLSAYGANDVRNNPSGRWFSGNAPRRETAQALVDSGTATAQNIQSIATNRFLTERNRLLLAGVNVANANAAALRNIGLSTADALELNLPFANLTEVAPAATSAIESTGSAADRAANRIRPLNMTLEEYVQNLSRVRDANETLGVLGVSGVGGSDVGDSEVTGVSVANANRRLHSLQMEREALELGADTWKRYLDSLTTAQKRGLESDFADQIRVERNNGTSASEAQRILAEAAEQMPRIYEAANRVANAGPTGADRGRAIEALADSYNNLGGALRRYQIQVALATDADLDSEAAAGLLASVRRESILEYRDILGVQGQVLAAYHEQETTLRNLNVLSQQFGLDVTEAKIDAALRYSQALRQIVENTPEGKIQAQLRDNLMSIAEGAASSISTMLGTYTAMKQYEDTVLRSQRAIFHGFTGTNPQADATANSLADMEMNNRRAIFAMEQAAARFNSQISAIGSSIDQVGDSLTDFILGAETDFAALAMSITRELTKAFLIDPMMANFKAGISNMVMNSPISSFLGMANTAASGAASALDATSQALLTSAGTSLNAAGVSLNASGVTLNASAAVVTGSGTALVGAATGLGGAATGLGGSAFALGSAAAALSGAAAVLSASGAASGGSDALAFAARMIPAVFGAPVAHSGGVIGTTAFRTRSVIGMGSALPAYHNGGIAGLKPREVLSVLKMGEEVLPEGNPRHIKNVGKFDGPQNYQAPISNTIQGDTYEIHLTVQTPTPSGNPQQDSRAQQEMAKTAAEALDSVIKQRGDKSRRTRSMSVA